MSWLITIRDSETGEVIERFKLHVKGFHTAFDYATDNCGYRGLLSEGQVFMAMMPIGR